MGTTRTIILFAPPRLALIALLVAFIASCATPTGWPSSIATHAPEIIGEGISLLWSVAPLYVPATEETHLATGERVSYAIGSLDRGKSEQLMAFDNQDGHLLWSSAARVTTLAVSGDVVYVGAIDLAEAYASSGDSLWRAYLRSRTVIALFPDGPHLNVISANRELHVLDSASGQLIARRYEARVIASYGGLDYSPAIAVAGLLAADSTSGQVLWVTDLTVSPSYPLVFTKDLVLVRSSPFEAKVVALEQTTGEIRWTSPLQPASNVAANDRVTTFLTVDASLVVLDNTTGDLLAQIRFGPSALPLRDSGLHPRSYEVSLSPSGDMLLAYFGDSRQLFAFLLTTTSQ